MYAIRPYFLWCGHQWGSRQLVALGSREKRERSTTEPVFNTQYFEGMETRYAELQSSRECLLVSDETSFTVIPPMGSRIEIHSPNPL